MFKHRVYDHVINFKKEFFSPSFKLYNINHNKMQELRRYFDKNLIKNFIKINYFQIASFVLFVKKSEKNLRFYIDYRNLNIIMIKNRYLLFFISEILNRFSRVKCFIKLNIILTFNRFRIRENDESFIIFRIRFEFFEYFVMLFDLYNEFASFQHYINDILEEFFDNFYIVYLDNIFIYSEIEVEHEIHIKRIFQKLKKTGFQIDIIKCEFHVNRVFYLGLIIITENIKMNFVKIEIIVQ